MLESGASGGPSDGDGNNGRSDHTSRISPSGADVADLKRMAESMILCYHRSLTEGCGDASCENVNCVSSGKLKPLSSNEAAARALHLFTSHAPLCQVLQIATTNPSVGSSSSLLLPVPTSAPVFTADASTTGIRSPSVVQVMTVAGGSNNLIEPSSDPVVSESLAQEPSAASLSFSQPPIVQSESDTVHKMQSESDLASIISSFIDQHVHKSDETSLFDAKEDPCDGRLSSELLSFTLEECHSEQNYSKLRGLLWSVFSNELALKRSFVKKASASAAVPCEQFKFPPSKKRLISGPISDLAGDCMPEISSKEQLRATQSDLDKDIDSAAECDINCDESTSTLDHMSVQDDSLLESMQVDDSQDNLPCTSAISLTDGSCSSKDSCNISNVINSSSDDRNISALSRTVFDSEKDTKVLGLPVSEDSLGKNWAIGYTVLKTSIPEPQIDFIDLHKTYDLLKTVPYDEYSSTLLNAQLQLLKDCLAMKFKASKIKFQKDLKIVDILIMLLENPFFIGENDYTEVLEPLSEILTLLGDLQKAILVVHLAKTYSKDHLNSFLSAFHHLITIKLITTDPGIGTESVQYEKTICTATKSMQLLFLASILAGEVDLPLLRDMPAPSPILPSFFAGSESSKTPYMPKAPRFNPLCQLLGVHPLDSREPLIPFSEFYHEFLSEQLEVDQDYAYYKADIEKFSFLHHPYILTPATKVLALYYDNRIRMYSERRMSVFHTLTEGLPNNPYLKLKVQRDTIISDALVELEVVAMESPSELRKQLVVEFEGEQGVDEGGVSKEFFQLITEQLFCPDFGMFSEQQDTGLMWFNPRSFESDAQFSLVGLVLGLAIYNNVILDLHLPPVLYKKLCGKPGTFHDLQHWNPTVYRSLLSILEYEGDDMEDMFVQSFRVGYQDVFGGSFSHDLKEDGGNVMVGQHNKHEFVSLYSSWLLNGMVEQQFGPFLRGFLMVTEESPLTKLFRPDELELLLCGSQHYDFSELQKSAEYDGGYSTSSPVVQWFWELVTAMSSDDQKQLLQFATGSARAPVGGLTNLKLVIARHGPDTDRLPTAHTCFNVLLLPDYCSKEKLHDRLTKAIKYSHGFGML